VPFQVPLAMRGLRTPKLLHVVSDSREVVRVSTDYTGPFGVLARAFAHHTEHELRRLVHEPRTRVAANGAAMWTKLRCRHGRIVLSSSIRAQEIAAPQRYLPRDPPRLLFAAYLRPEKGIGVLLDAFDALRAHRPLKLTLAGGTDRQGTTERAVLARVARSPYAADIAVTGLFDFGPELFDLYRDHDLFVLPSLSEGTPRTLVEARAFGCPVVASDVGGVPTSVEHGRDGLLVAPGDAGALAASIARALDDTVLRRRLIDEGSARARGATLERFVGELELELELLLGRTQASSPRAAAPAVGAQGAG